MTDVVILLLLVARRLQHSLDRVVLNQPEMTKPHFWSNYLQSGQHSKHNWVAVVLRICVHWMRNVEDDIFSYQVTLHLKRMERGKGKVVFIDDICKSKSKVRCKVNLLSEPTTAADAVVAMGNENLKGNQRVWLWWPRVLILVPYD